MNIARVTTAKLAVRPFGVHRARYMSNIGFVGLGHMGSKMVRNLRADGHSLLVYDNSTEAIQSVVGDGITAADSVAEIGAQCSTVLTMLPNDAIVENVATTLLQNSASKDTFTHISCSTVSPTTARGLAIAYKALNHQFISSPVFARPDGIAKKQAYWLVSGQPEGREKAGELLKNLGQVVDFGDDTGAGNVVKLCGNFLIASSIEAISEAMALAEKNDVDRKIVMDLLSSTIFDCLIYKGYGQRVSDRDHRPGGFSLELGLKDVSLVSKAAKDKQVPMPFLSVLLDRYTSAKAKGRADFDWSAIGINVAEDAGIDVSADVQKNKDAIARGETY